MTVDRRSAEATAYRRLYKTARWKALRIQQLMADPLCTMCQDQGLVTAATVCDHIKEHKGDESLFFDPANLQSLCGPHHDSTKQAQDKRGYVIGCDLAGRPKDAGHPWNRTVDSKADAGSHRGATSARQASLAAPAVGLIPYGQRPRAL